MRPTDRETAEDLRWLIHETLSDLHLHSEVLCKPGHCKVVVVGAPDNNKSDADNVAAAANIVRSKVATTYNREACLHQLSDGHYVGHLLGDGGPYTLEITIDPITKGDCNHEHA